jgi:hypothetical protein
MPAQRPKDTFRVHALAAAKKPKRKDAPKHGEVTVKRVNPEALALARNIAHGRDVHVEVRPDGTIDIVNGSKH